MITDKEIKARLAALVAGVEVARRTGTGFGAAEVQRLIIQAAELGADMERAAAADAMDAGASAAAVEAERLELERRRDGGRAAGELRARQAAFIDAGKIIRARADR